MKDRWGTWDWDTVESIEAVVSPPPTCDVRDAADAATCPRCKLALCPECMASTEHQMHHEEMEQGEE